MPGTWSNPTRRLGFKRFVSDANLDCFRMDGDNVRSYRDDIPVPWKVNNVKRPGRMRLGSYQALAHGADSVLYFQWRASRGGHERFHSAMLPHSGTGSRTWQEIEALGTELPRIAEAADTTAHADIAVLFDSNAWWGLTETRGLPRNDFDYPRLATDHYRPLLEAHHAVDTVSFGSDLSRYQVVVIPNAYLVDDAFTDALTRFTESGGTLVCSFFSGVVDAHNHVRQPAYPGAFRALIGAYIDEYWPARPDRPAARTARDPGEHGRPGGASSTSAPAWRPPRCATPCSTPCPPRASHRSSTMPRPIWRRPGGPARRRSSCSSSTTPTRRPSASPSPWTGSTWSPGRRRTGPSNWPRSPSRSYGPGGGR